MRAAHLRQREPPLGDAFHRIQLCAGRAKPALAHEENVCGAATADDPKLLEGLASHVGLEIALLAALLALVVALAGLDTLEEGGAQHRRQRVADGVADEEGRSDDGGVIRLPQRSPPLVADQWPAGGGQGEEDGDGHENAVTEVLELQMHDDQHHHVGAHLRSAREASGRERRETREAREAREA